MRYALTYCTMDHQFSGNPFWHSCLLFSQWDEEGKIEVIDNWGFYGVPSTVRNTWLSKLKITLGLDVDLKGNHGMLKREELRYLDAGFGLHGVTFELTKEKFEMLQYRCNKMNEEQKQAIKEAVEEQGIKAKSPEKTRIYEYEDLSSIIYTREKFRATQNGQEPRLKPFELILNFSIFGGLTLHQSHTCKSQLISLLDQILSPAQIARLTENGKHPTIPRYSGQMETIFLHSSGPLREHKKTSGEIVYYRDLQDEGVALHWTLPPQEMETLSQETIELFQISKDYANDVKKMIHQLQKLEWLFINVKLPENYSFYQKALITRIREHYQAFAQLEPKEATERVTGWLGYAFSLLSAPRDRDEKLLLQKINESKALCNALFMAIADGWRIDFDLPLESDEEPSNPLEALASYLKTTDQKKLCAIIGRTYTEPYVDNSEANAPSI